MSEQGDYLPEAAPTQPTSYPVQPQAYGASAPQYAPGQQPHAVPQQIINVQQNAAPAYGVGNDKSAGVAYLLLFLIGFLGGHQFYLGKPGRGIGYLLTFGWLTIGLWIDLFTLPAQVKNVNMQRRMGLR